MCHELGVKTVIEMVDRQASLDFARESGADYVQGYLFGKPNGDIAVFARIIPPHLFGALQAIVTRDGRSQSGLTRVPTPYSVNSSSSRACGTRPSMITAPSTPFSTASTHVSIFGIMPPRMVPSAM